jgi:hypothetical protein
MIIQKFPQTINSPQTQQNTAVSDDFAVPVGQHVGHSAKQSHVGFKHECGEPVRIHTGIVSTSVNFSEHQKKIDANKRKWKLKRHAERLMPEHRTNYCMRRVGTNAEGVQLYHNPTINNAHFQNLAHCDNVWTCPVCSATISSRRANELQLAINKWHQAGGNTCMLTYTMRHKRDDDENLLVSQLRSAKRKMYKDREGRNLRKSVGYSHAVTALEVTYHDRNGFHIHIHEMLFLDPDLVTVDLDVLDDNALETYLNDKLSPLWIKSLESFGASADLVHGFKVSTGEQFRREYVAKFGHLPKDDHWTEANELALSSSKRGKPNAVIKRGWHPFEILEKTQGNPNSRWGRIWARYVKFTKGKNQLTWSPGAKDFFGINDLDDSQIIEELHKETSDKSLVCDIPFWVWEAVLHYDKRVDLLNRCIKNGGDKDKIIEYLTKLNKRYSKGRSGREHVPDWIRGTIWDYKNNKSKIDGVQNV